MQDNIDLYVILLTYIEVEVVSLLYQKKKGEKNQRNGNAKQTQSSGSEELGSKKSASKRNLVGKAKKCQIN